jgi:hypothetical protein
MSDPHEDPPPPAQEPKRFPWEDPLPGSAEDPE